MIDFLYKKGVINVELKDDITYKSVIAIGKIYKEIHNAKTSRTINVIFNSRGGDAVAGRICYRMLKDIQSRGHKVHTLATMHCSSAAILPYLAGSKRYAFKETCFGVHQGYLVYDKMNMHVDELSRDSRSLKKMEDGDWKAYKAEGVKLPKNIMDKIMKARDTIFLDGALAKRYGLVKEVL